MTDLALAVDIGGTKMAVGLVDRSGTLRERVQVPTRAGKPGSVGGGPDDEDRSEVLWRTLADLVQQVQLRVPPMIASRCAASDVGGR